MKSVKKILVAEDEDAIRSFMVINLRRVGYEVYETTNGQEALDLFHKEKGDFDIVVLDVMMPGIDGFAVCREIRRHSSTIGIIMLTARTQEIDRVQGLNLGADDYITKPFSPSELIARIDALYRRVAMSEIRTKNKFQEELRSGEFILNLRERTLLKNGNPIELTQVEFQILEYFFANKGTVLSRSEILEKVWGDVYFGDEKIVDVNIRRLRVKIEDEPSSPKYIVTVWGIGYKWAVTD